MEWKLTFWAGWLLQVAVWLTPGGVAHGSEDYPASRFGSGPAPIEGGRPRISAIEEADEWSGGTTKGQGRNPASLQGGDADRVRTGAKAGSDLDAILQNRKGVQEVALIAGDLGYFPKTLFVNRDIPVRMFVTGASKSSLCLMMDSFQIRKQIRSQKIEEISFTPNVPGQYRFYCPMNGMEGTLVVRELSSQ